MNKIVYIALCGAVFIGFGANAAPRYLSRDGAGAYNVTYDYYNEEKTGWYASLRAQINFLNWTQKYSSDWPLANEAFNEDSYSFEPVFGGNLAVGKRFSYFWRAELELGYTGNFEDADAGFTFNMYAPYALVNFMYDFSGGDNGVYVGGGIGAAFATTTLDWDSFVQESRKDTTISPMAGLMLGYSHKLDAHFVLDVRYRLAGWLGGTQTRHFQDTDDNMYYLDVDTGLVIENSLSVGLRYEF